ncbi:MAG: DHH family phosphoesterase [Clostridia bacterium]|nr:DHH family phosphoesterase [Clostridia bacterium]
MKNKKFKRLLALFGIVLPLISIFCMVSGFVLIDEFPGQKGIIIGSSLCGFAVITGIFAIVTACAKSKAEALVKKGPLLGTVMYDKINYAKEPAFICDSNRKIVWANAFASTELSNKKILGASIDSVIDYDFLEETVVRRERENKLELDGEVYLVEETKIEASDDSYYLLYLRNKTKQSELEQLRRDKEKIVAYVVVDNLEALLQFEQEKYRETAAKVEKIIRSWAESVNGIVKEYEKDKYIFIFNMEDLDKFINDEFSILDKIKDIRLGSGSIPVTLSIGIAKKASATLAEKEKLAHVALDMALQRGGDQAVVKLEEDVRFFGGRTNAIHKRTKVRARVVASAIASRIQQASNVLVMGHAYPDYDAIGASIGVARLAKHCGVKVNIVTNFKDINAMKVVKMFDGIDEYRNVFVDSAKGLDLVKSDTLLIIVDVNNVNMFESRDLAKIVDNIIIIDHHRQTAEFQKAPIISYIETSASSTCEIVSEMLEQVLPIQSLLIKEANALYAGILLDTKNFQKGAGPKTHGAAMYLKDNGASYENVQDLFKANIVDYKKEASFGEKIEIYRNCMAIALNPYGKDTTDKILAAKVADNLLGLEDVSASFVLVQIDNVVHISARSNGTINVQLILERLNGGGRYDAAGAQVRGSNVGDTLITLKEAIDSYINPEG